VVQLWWLACERKLCPKGKHRFRALSPHGGIDAKNLTRAGDAASDLATAMRLPRQSDELLQSQLDHDTALRALKARVDDRPLDAMRAFLDRGFEETDENLFGQAAGRYVDRNLNRQGLDADEREGSQFGAIDGSSPSRAGRGLG
jgi:hypothetical protein